MFYLGKKMPCPFFWAVHWRHFIRRLPSSGLSLSVLNTVKSLTPWSSAISFKTLPSVSRFSNMSFLYFKLSEQKVVFIQHSYFMLRVLPIVTIFYEKYSVWLFSWNLSLPSHLCLAFVQIFSASSLLSSTFNPCSSLRAIRSLTSL